jgi:hypothetical protein
VYYNNSLMGEFDLPCTFPVITNGSATGRLQVFPGIAYNGRNSAMDIYPFYRPDTSLLVPQTPGKVVNFTPVTTYYTGIKPYVIADFEKGTVLNFGLAEGLQPLAKVTDDSLLFEGNGSGRIIMTAVGDSSTDSSTVFTIPSGSAVIEFNYKSDVQFYVGLRSNLTNTVSSSPYYLAGINPSDHWQKFYLNVKAFALQYPGNNYNFYIKTVLPTGQATGRVLIDNIQLITF